MVPLRWSDMDAYGHINNVQFLRLLEEARVLTFIDRLDGGSEAPVTGLLVARSEIEYLEPMLYRVEPIAVDVWVSRIGAADLDMDYEVLDGPANGDGPGQVYAHAETQLVAYDLATSRPRRISAPERARLETWLDEPVRWRRRRGRSVGPLTARH
jgi:acyl-CoA thioester hydrolase